MRAFQRLMVAAAPAVCGAVLLAHAPQGPSSAARQTEADEYTRYELLAPDTARFRILYDVTSTTPGAKFYFNAIRKGSEASDEAVFDVMTGSPLKFQVVTGAGARASGHPTADPDTSYIKVQLARPVPPDGEVRIRIDKIYKDPKSYSRDGDLIMFSRSLGIKRNAVVLPAGYELVACNMPSQILSEPDGRITISFLNANPDAVSLVVKGRLKSRSRGSATGDQVVGADQPRSPSRTQPAAATNQLAPAPTTPPLGNLSFPERARQDREIVYFLRSPETHTFDLYHDYTETREGTDKYLNIVRAGSTVSNPSARILDTGEVLRTETLEGDEITRAGIDIGEAVKPQTEVVVIRFPAVKKGRSVRLRIEETYTDPGRYRLAGDELVWHRAFGRPRNGIVLPAGWYVTASSIPAVVTETPDGRIRLDYVNPRPDEIDVVLKAKRRTAIPPSNSR